MVKILKNIIDKFKNYGSGLYKYNDYEEYRKVQIEGNLKKLHKVWVDEGDMKFLAEYIKRNISDPVFGICHGTRQGKEQEWLRKYLGIEVIGTEISPTARQFPHTIEWDFHNVKSEWLNNVDFIYSNSFDHSYKPQQCLDAWMSCIKPNGFCILEWTESHLKYSRLDPFGGSFEDYKQLIEGKYELVEVLINPEGEKNKKFFVIKHKNSQMN